MTQSILGFARDCRFELPKQPAEAGWRCRGGLEVLLQIYGTSCCRWLIIVMTAVLTATIVGGTHEGHLCVAAAAGVDDWRAGLPGRGNVDERLRGALVQPVDLLHVRGTHITPITYSHTIVITDNIHNCERVSSFLSQYFFSLRITNGGLDFRQNCWLCDVHGKVIPSVMHDAVVVVGQAQCVCNVLFELIPLICREKTFNFIIADNIGSFVSPNFNLFSQTKILYIYSSFTWRWKGFETKPRRPMRPYGLWLKFLFKKLSLQNRYKRSDLKILRNGDPVGLRLNRVKSGQPSSAKCAFHKSFKYTFYSCLNCQLYFSLCTWMEWLRNKVISTSIQ